MKRIQNILKTIEDSLLINNNGFGWVQSTNQYFYLVEDASINGIELTDNDWIVAYNGDIIVGSRMYIVGGNIDIPIMGYDSSSDSIKISTQGYCEKGDIPIIKVHRENNEVVQMDVVVIEGSLEFDFGHAKVILKKD